MKLDPIKGKILCAKIIPNVNSYLAENLKLEPEQRSLAIFTADIDDIAYTAIDEATKKADVKVVYARSMYAGSTNASTKFAGEFIGILAGANPAEVISGLNAANEFIESGGCFYSANEDDSVSFYAHTVSRTGSYLSGIANVSEGEPMAYLIAPPLEAMYGLDAALKAADVKLVAFYGPPSETNFGGGLLTGTQAACKAACDAFKEAVIYVANAPLEF